MSDLIKRMRTLKECGCSKKAKKKIRKDDDIEHDGEVLDETDVEESWSKSFTKKFKCLKCKKVKTLTTTTLHGHKCACGGALYAMKDKKPKHVQGQPVDCRKCHGSKYEPNDSDLCAWCGGSGQEPCPMCGEPSEKGSQYCSKKCADEDDMRESITFVKEGSTYRRQPVEKKGAKEVGTGKKAQGKVDQKRKGDFAKQVSDYVTARAKTAKDDDA